MDMLFVARRGSDVTVSCPSRGRRGSIMFAFLLIVGVFLVIAAFGVDLSRHIMLERRAQKIADGAALAGAQALNQFSDQPDQSKAPEAALDYIAARQGQKHVDLYDKQSDTNFNNIMVEKFEDGDGDTYYKVGVLVFEDFEPIFLPRGIFGDRPEHIMTQAVARLDSRITQKMQSDPMNCALIVGSDPSTGDLDINGNNFNIEDGDMCSDADITFDKGKDDDFPIQQWEDADCTDKKAAGDACADRSTYSDDKDEPKFQHTNSGVYRVDLSDYSSWSSTPCSDGRAMETDSDSSVTWGSGGSQVCVEESTTGSFQGYQFTNESQDKIQTSSGDPVTIYADDSLRFRDNGSGIKGGLYSEEDIVIEKNDGQFVGDKDELDGLALYAERDLIIEKNNTYIEGIVGAGRDMKYTSNGGGKNEVRGIVLVGRSFLDDANSNSRDDITHDTSVYRDSGVDLSDWVVVLLLDQNVPDFSRTNAYLVD